MPSIVAHSLPLHRPARIAQGSGYHRPTGTPVYATAKGQVISADKAGACGLIVNIDHDSELSTSDVHLHSIVVKKGQSVSRGELVGYVGLQ